MVSEQLLPCGTEVPLRGPAAHWSRCAPLPACVPQHPVASCQGTRAMWVPRVVPRSWAAFSGHARSPGLVPFCVPRATRRSTPCPSPVPYLGLRLGRGHFRSLRKNLGVSLLRKLLRSSSSGDAKNSLYPSHTSYMAHTCASLPSIFHTTRSSPPSWRPR